MHVHILLFQSSSMRFVLTWGASPRDLDSLVQFYDANGDKLCLLVYHNKNCGNYASLDVDDTSVG